MIKEFIMVITDGDGSISSCKINIKDEEGINFEEATLNDIEEVIATGLQNSDIEFNNKLLFVQMSAVDGSKVYNDEVIYCVNNLSFVILDEESYSLRILNKMMDIKLTSMKL